MMVFDGCIEGFLGRLVSASDLVGWPYGTGHDNIPVPTQMVEIFNKQVLFLAGVGNVGYPLCVSMNNATAHMLRKVGRG